MAITCDYHKVITRLSEEKEKLEGVSPTSDESSSLSSRLFTSGEGREDALAVLAATSRVQGTQRSFQASQHGCRIPLSFCDERCSELIFCVGNGIFGFLLRPQCPTRAVCGQTRRGSVSWLRTQESGQPWIWVPPTTEIPVRTTSHPT